MYSHHIITLKYHGGLRRWKQWAMKHMISVLPADGCNIALYLQHQGEERNFKCAVEEVVNYLIWMHAIGGISSSTPDLLTLPPIWQWKIEGFPWDIQFMTTHPGHHTLLNTHYSMHYLLRVMHADFSKPTKTVNMNNGKPCSFYLKLTWIQWI